MPVRLPSSNPSVRTSTVADVSQVIGPSTTQLFRNLSIALKFSPGDEIICSKLDHEANIASWVAIAERENLALKWWSADPSPNPRLDPAVLKNLMSPKTKLVACTHASNILGTIVDIKTIARTVHEVPGALLCVDGVSFAPHRHIDVRELEADFYAFSWYKVQAPSLLSTVPQRRIPSASPSPKS